MESIVIIKNCSVSYEVFFSPRRIPGWWSKSIIVTICKPTAGKTNSRKWTTFAKPSWNKVSRQTAIQLKHKYIYVVCTLEVSCWGKSPSIARISGREKLLRELEKKEGEGKKWKRGESFCWWIDGFCTELCPTIRIYMKCFQRVWRPSDKENKFLPGWVKFFSPSPPPWIRSSK